MSLADTILERAVHFIPVLLSLTVHEWAHAWSAWKLGDDTAKMMGRVSLNPLDHIDPVGTLLLPLMGVPFGWAKPVPINPTRFGRTISMPMGVLLTAAAGPISNVVLAAIAFACLAGMSNLASPAGPLRVDPATLASIRDFLQMLIVINVVLATFNMLPIPPLDGSRIVDAMVPEALRPLWLRFSSLGAVLLILVILMPYLGGISIVSIPVGWVTGLTSWVIP
jgi:Zn-dependent protease